MIVEQEQDIRPTNHYVKMKLVFYYTDVKLNKQFNRKNNNKHSEISNVIDKYQFDEPHCNNQKGSSYAGCTATTLKEITKQHVSMMKQHRSWHNCNIIGWQILLIIIILSKLNKEADLLIGNTFNCT